MDTPESNPRFQKIDKISLLAHCPLFSGLSPWELKAISRLMRLVEYKKDDVLYKEGGEAGSFYVVVSGRFEASVNQANKKKVLAYLRRGDYFGEMSLLTNQPHSATLRALSDSLTLELKKEDFKQTVEHNATISLELSRRLSSRLKGADPRSRSLFKSDVIALWVHPGSKNRTVFPVNLASSLFQETHQKTVLLDMSPSGHEISSSLGIFKNIPISELNDLDSASVEALGRFLVRHPSGFDVLSVAHGESGRARDILIPLLNYLAIDYRFILIHMPLPLDETVTKALSQADSIYLVSDSHLNDVTETRETALEIEKNLPFPEEKIFVVINEVLLGVRTTSNTKKELFGKKICYSLPSTPAAAEREASYATPLVLEEPDLEYSRTIRHIARHVSNNLVGLVLGSGAALGLAHIGVLKVLEREKIPIDLIAGSSIGSLIGSLYAVGKTALEVEEAALEINGRLLLGKLMDLNLLPIRGLMHGESVMKHFRRHLGNKTFDDCRIPLKIVGANLSTRQIHVFESGYISDAVRASIAIPAIFKPVFMDKDVIVDGGILSPLPIRALNRAGANKIIAVNVFPTSKDALERRIMAEEAAEKEQMQMRKKNRLSRAMYRLKKRVARGLRANVFDVLMNTIQAMEAEIAEVEGESADVLLRPVVPDANWVEFYKPQAFIRRGEEETARLMPKIKALVYQQNT